MPRVSPLVAPDTDRVAQAVRGEVPGLHRTRSLLGASTGSHRPKGYALQRDPISEALDGAPDRGHADLMDAFWLLSGAADQNMRVVVDDRKLAHHAYLDLIAHSSVIGPIRRGDETSGVQGVGDQGSTGRVLVSIHRYQGSDEACRTDEQNNEGAHEEVHGDS